jgi:hypothetical protein
MRPWLKVLSAMLTSTIWSTGCVTSPSREPSGATQFASAENDRVIVTGAVFQPVTLDGNYYMRWTFTIRPTQTIGVSSIRIDDVTGASPFPLVNDIAPQLENGQWNERSGLMDLSSIGVQWLSDPGESARLFRISIAWLDGRNDLLEQRVSYSQDAKRLLLASVGR